MLLFLHEIHERHKRCFSCRMKSCAELEFAKQRETGGVEGDVLLAMAKALKAAETLSDI